MEHKERALSLLGLARRGGKIKAGFDAAVEAAQARKAALLLAAWDVSVKTYKNLRYEADKAKIPAARITADMSEVSKACNIKAGVLAITDKGFAKAIIALTEAVKQEKEEDAI